MIIKNVKFTLFGDYKNIEAKPEKMVGISNELMLNGVTLIPGTFQQVSPKMGMKAFERMVFNNNQEKLTVEVGIDTIEISKIIVNINYIISNQKLDQFLYIVKKIIKVLKNSNEEFTDGRRVSLVTETLYDTETIKPLDEIYRNVNNTLPNYSDEETFEWNTRAAKRNNFKILGHEEKVNVVTEVLRTSGEHNLTGELKVFDTIQARIDVNTVNENVKLRINEEFIAEFLGEANTLMTSHEVDLGVKLYGDN
jgi:hypothetical protein